MRSFGVLAAAVATGLVAAGGCGEGGQLTGAGGGIGLAGRGGQIMTGGGGSGAGGVTGFGGDGPDPCYAPYAASILPPDVLIVLDTSASMNDGFDGACAGGCGASSKWTAAVAAIDAVADGPTPATANWGLKLMNDGADACDAGGVAISPGPYTGAEISYALANRSIPPGLARPGNTPARVAIDGAAANLMNATDLGRKLIVLMMDGVPDCQAGASDPLASDVDGAIAALTYATAAGFPVCIIGFGTAGGPADATLAQMAAAAPTCPVSPAYIPISNGADLVDALDTIGAQAGACLYAIPPPPPGADTSAPSLINLFIDGTQILQDYTHTDGWDFTDSARRTVQLYGAACTTSQGQYVTVKYYCSLI